MDQFKNLMIGLFVTVAAFIIIFILMFLHPNVGDEGKLLYVRFTDIDKVTPGTRVAYAGKPVGEVVDIKEVEFGRSGRTDESGRVYLYELKLRVDSAVNVYNTDEISLHTSGLLGEKNVEITPYAPKPNEKLKIIDKEVLYAKETGSVEDTFKQLKEVAGRFDTALDLIIDILEQVNNQNIVEKIARTIENVESITGALNMPEDLTNIVANVHALSQRALHSWDTVDSTLANFDAMGISARDIADKIAHGNGTIGKLVTNDDLYLRTNSILSKLETTFDDINHYGLFFSSDKGWQRLRARRLNLLQKLRTPQEFRNYFNDEVDQISTSISRVYMVLDKLSCDPYCENMMQNNEFTKVFAELMRRVTMLEEEVRMYNTQIVETEVHETELGCPPLCPQNPCECSGWWHQ